MSAGMPLRGVDSVLTSALGGLSARQRAIANNVANVDTPGFKGSDVVFEEQLQRALGRRQPIALATTDQGHVRERSGGEPAFAPHELGSGGTIRNDGNNVDIDLEMVKLADTSIKFNATTRLVSARFALLQSIISEGRK